MSFYKQLSGVASDLGIKQERFHCPDGGAPREKIGSHCSEFEALVAAAGGIDFQILGIGRNGHIGFNEPGSPIESRTRVIRLNELTRRDAADRFNGVEHVPHEGLTSGIGTILDAKEICLMAFGDGKANIIRQTVEAEISKEVPASFIRRHDNATIYLDKDAAKCLSASELISYY